MLLILQLLLSDPKQSAGDSPDKPAAVRAALEKGSALAQIAAADSFADFFKGVLRCYHPSARFYAADRVQAPWDRQAQYAAAGSALVRIGFLGAFSGNHYDMTVAMLTRGTQLRAVVVSDGAPIAYNTNCALEQWVQIARSAAPEGVPAKDADD